MDLENNYDKITKAIAADEVYENVLHEVCHMPHVTNLKEFYKMYELEEKAIDKEYDNQPKIAPTIELFAEVFKKYDEYPANLQKLKKGSTTRDRLNSTISRSSPTLNDSIGISSNNQNKQNSSSLLNLNKFDDVPTASETLNNFVKFQKQLKQLYVEISQQDVEKEYASKVKQLSLFAQQLEKLLPTEKAGNAAFSAEEEAILDDLASKMDDLSFIRNHHNVCHQPNELTNVLPPKLESLVNILSHCLLDMNSFNIN